MLLCVILISPAIRVFLMEPGLTQMQTLRGWGLIFKAYHVVSGVM